MQLIEGRISGVQCDDLHEHCVLESLIVQRASGYRSLSLWSFAIGHALSLLSGVLVRDEGDVGVCLPLRPPARAYFPAAPALRLPRFLPPPLRPAPFAPVREAA